jgi:hypothetical protein
MSVIGSNILAGASGQGGDYTIARSLRFRSSASAYLSRTPATTTNRQTYTWSGWVKTSLANANASDMPLLTSRPLAGTFTLFQLKNSNTLQFNDSTAGGAITTTQVFRDPSAWYHIVLAVDTTQATAANRVKMYVNGSQITSFSATTYPAQNGNTQINVAQVHNIGRDSFDTSALFDGYVTEINFIDGQALTPSSFGETSATTGVWQPIEYIGTYGTNGFYLPFTDNSALTTSSNVGLGKDFSGNGNYWTTNNISITAGVTYDSMTDVPTLTSATASNYAVMNPLCGRGTFSNANLTVVSSVSTAIPSTIFSSAGKYYWEVLLVDATYGRIGICNLDGANQGLGETANTWCYLTDGRVFHNNSASSYGVTATDNDIINVALDLDAGKIWYGKNGTWMASGVPNTGSNPSQSFTANQTMTAAIAYGFVSGTDTFTTNFGQRPFAYTPPTGFVALNTFNLPTPTIGATASTQAGKNFNIVTYTGTGSSRAVTGVGFQPDLIWWKSRSAATSHALVNAVTGAKGALSTNNTSAEYTESTNNGLLSFDTDGFTVGNDGNYTAYNSSGSSIVAWNWKANGAGSSNTAGSITSTVSANPTAGFSVVTYTGTGANATVGHGLGVAPSMVIVKSRDNTRSWQTYHTSIGNNRRLLLNTTDAQSGTSAIYWNNTTPTSSVVSIGTDGNCNASGEKFVAYCFSEVQGYSKFGSYTGNGSTDGPFIFTGFRPRYVMIKCSSNGGGGYAWLIYDTVRNTYNTISDSLQANASDATYTDTVISIDVLSNGFKIRGTAIGINQNGGTMVYACFAENPFKYSLAR